jgi:hypothetical protein
MIIAWCCIFPLPPPDECLPQDCVVHDVVWKGIRGGPKYAMRIYHICYFYTGHSQVKKIDLFL